MQKTRNVLLTYLGISEIKIGRHFFPFVSSLVLMLIAKTYYLLLTKNKSA